MTPDLPDAALDILSSYLTCEFATFSKSGIPIAWPVSALYRHDDHTVLASTTIGLPRKALNLRRDPRVALLYSDPTGSGLDGRHDVLLQGSASVTDAVETRFATRTDYWVRLLRIRPSEEGSIASSALGRFLMSAYFMRLYITVRPQTMTLSDENPEESASGLRAVAAPAPCNRPVRPKRRATAFEKTVAMMPAFDSAVLAASTVDRRATLARVRPVSLDDRATLVLDLPHGAVGDVAVGPASLLFHRHNAQLDNQLSFVAIGELEHAASGFRFTVTRFVPGGRPGRIAQVKALLAMRRGARRYLRRRGLPTPVIAWDELAAVHAAAALPDGPRDDAA